MERIASGNVANMVDSTSAALLAEIERKRKRVKIWPWTALLAAVVFFTAFNAKLSAWLLYPLGAVLLACVVGAFYWDVLKKSVVMMYDLEGESEAAFRQVYDAVSCLARCGAAWHVSSRGDVYDPKYHAGASGIVSRQTLRVADQDPPYIRTNLSIIRIPAGNRILYFFPDQVLLFSPQGVGAIRYDHLCVDFSPTRFIESGRVPRDASVVDQTWKYVNKSGGPDRRFKDNHRIPICEYEQIHLTSKSGLNEQIQASRLGIGQELSRAFKTMGRTLEECQNTPAPQPLVVSSSLPGPATEPSQANVSYKAEACRPSPRRAAATSPPAAHTPSMDEVYEALLQIMCCVMVADGRASTIEKQHVKEMMVKVRAPWTPEEIDQRVIAFINRVHSEGYRSILSQSLSRVQWFRDIGRTDILCRCVDGVMNADGKVSPQESALCARIKELASG